jgi:anti-anti-sigma regulatory factor
MVFSGAYDVTCKRQWSEELERLCTEPNVIIDFSDVSSLDATCLTEMLRMHERRRDNGFDRETIRTAAMRADSSPCILRQA